MITPVGELTKEETRAAARRHGLVTADKKESVEICFVPDGDYAAVLARHLGTETPALAPGSFLNTAGDVVLTVTPDTRSANAKDFREDTRTRCSSWRSSPSGAPS